MSRANVDVGHIREYDSELGRITECDLAYADELLDDLEGSADPARYVAEWFRKVRYEAVMADRKARSL